MLNFIVMIIVMLETNVIHMYVNSCNFIVLVIIVVF